MDQKNHIWNFSTVGGVKRVSLESGADLVHLAELDQKLWTALSCPVFELEIDAKTLQLIDADGDGQIRVPEILAAVKWITSIIKNPDDLLKEEPVLQLSSIHEETPLGKSLLESAYVILKNLGKEGATSLTVEETSSIEKIFAGTPFNGDGIISEDSVNTEELKILINQVIDCVGALPDRGGKNGVNTALIETFFTDCEQYSAWMAKRENDLKNIAPFGDSTAEAYETYCSLKSKIDDYFIRCRLAAFDPASTAVLNGLVARIETISLKDLSTCLDEIATYPLSKIEAGKPLSIDTGINPAWEKTIKDFKTKIVDKLFLGSKTIDENTWNNITKTFEPFVKWQSEKLGAAVEKLSVERVNEIIATDYKAQLLKAIANDIDLEDEANSIILVDQLTRFHRDIFTLLKNFVTFYDFYSPNALAIFQAGTLYLDQRSLDLCIRVKDMAKQDAMVSYSGMYLVYCQCTSKKAGDSMTIVAALTNGDIDNLVVGRNALFYDRDGNDWDASVIKIIENPISIRQAFWSPYRKVAKFIEKKINKFASEEEDKVISQATKKIEEMPAKAVAAPATAPPPPFDIGKFVGIFAAIGLALGAIGTALTAVVAGFLGLVWWKIPFALLGVLLLISGPSMIIAFFKLRKRNLAPLLDANGWAINANAIVNIHFGNTLTNLATLPDGAKINLNDPFTKKGRPLYQTVLFVSILIGIVLYLLIRFEWIKIHF